MCKCANDPPPLRARRFTKTCSLLADPFDLYKDNSARGSTSSWLPEERELFKKALVQVASGGNPKNFVLVAEHFRGRRVRASEQSPIPSNSILQYCALPALFACV